MMNNCVIGNFGLTRKIANWNLSFSLIPRVIVAVILLVLPVYSIGMLFDLVLNNTLEFWTKSKLIGAAMPQTYNDGLYVVSINNELRPFKYTKIEIKNLETHEIDIIEISEKPDHTIDISKNYVTSATINHKNDLAKVSFYDNLGKLIVTEKYDLSDQRGTLAKLANLSLKKELAPYWTRLSIQANGNS